MEHLRQGSAPPQPISTKAQQRPKSSKKGAADTHRRKRARHETDRPKSGDLYFGTTGEIHFGIDNSFLSWALRYDQRATHMGKKAAQQYQESFVFLIRRQYLPQFELWSIYYYG